MLGKWLFGEKRLNKNLRCYNYGTLSSPAQNIHYGEDKCKKTRILFQLA